MTFRSALRNWLAPALVFAVGFVAGFLTFYPGWASAPRLTDGSAAGIERAARQIREADLLTEASPKERVAWLLEICKQPTSLRRDRALCDAIDHLQPGDFLAAVADLQEFGREMVAVDGSLIDSLVEASLERWLEVDEDGAIRWLGTSRAVADSGLVDLPSIDPSQIESVFTALTRHTPDRALELALKLGKKTHRETGVQTAFLQCARQDSGKARDWLEKLKDTPDWEPAFKACVHGLAESDPAAAFEMASTGEGGLRYELVSNIIQQAADKSPALASDLILKIDRDQRPNHLSIAMMTLAQRPDSDPLAWLDGQMAAMPEMTETESRTLAGGMGVLAARNGAATMEWIARLPESQRRVFAGPALRGWGAADPVAMIDWLKTQPAEQLPEESNALYQCASQEPERFASWAASLPAGAARDRVQLVIATQLAADGNVQQALQAAPTSLQDAEQARTLVAAIASRDLPATKRWIESIPEGAFQNGAVRGLVQIWATQTPVAVADWLGSLPSGTLRDSGAAAFAVATVSVTPEAATEWFGQIRDPNVRETSVADFYRKFSITDRSAARQWLTALPDVSEGLKSRLLAKR